MTNTVTESVAVVGAGQMGNGIAHVFAQAGFPVTMVDVSADALARGRDTIAKHLDGRLAISHTVGSDQPLPCLFGRREDCRD